MIKTFITTALLLTAPAAALSARTTAAKAFTDAPTQVFLLLDKNTRLDMIDYYNSPKNTSVLNELKGKSQITSLNDEMLTIDMSPASTATLIVLPAQKESDDVIAVINTVASPALDSRVTFYSAADWSKLDPSRYFKGPELADWLTPEGEANVALIESLVPFIMASYNYDPKTQTLTVKQDLETFLSTDVYDMIKSYLKPQLTYVWNGKKFNKTR